MKSLIIGMGIGELYKEVLQDLGHEVVTVDTGNRPADFKSIGLALDVHPKFDATFICTPNHTHEQIAYFVAKHSKIVFVEKPGVKTAHDWQILCDSYPKTKFIMVKNNQYREELPFFKAIANVSNTVNINWINYNRVPNPGSWFTNRHYSFGGVSRDLMPHLLSWIAAIYPTTYHDCNFLKFEKEQRWKLEDLLDTTYGTVVPDGMYDVDDYVKIELSVGKVHYNLTANWRSLERDDQSIVFIGDRERRFELGLCPVSAYKTMIETAFENISNPEWWKDQLDQDLWIHNMLGPYDEK
jgi:predicted dehydrogenase